MTEARPAWSDALAAAALLAVDPDLGGAVVRGPSGPARDAWLEAARGLLPADAPWRRLPAGADDGRLLGGLDLAAALGAGRKVLQRGLLADAHHGVLIAPMAERLDGAVAARLAAALDAGDVAVERDGFAERSPARFLLLALDEGEADERAPDALAERLAFRLDLTSLSTRDLPKAPGDRVEVAAVRKRLPVVEDSPEHTEALVGAAAALGVGSVRAPLFALRVARAAAALAGRETVEADDLALAARLVLAPRASRRPEEAADAPEAHAPERDPPADTEGEPSEADALQDLVLAAAEAALPPGLELWSAGDRRSGRDGGRGEGRARVPARRGRAVGVRPGAPPSAGQLHLAETLKAAAPWRVLRRAQSREEIGRAAVPIRKSDLRVRRYRRHAESTLVFVVDASGSAALHRLAEAKGAVELLLAEAYVRRTRVALVAFRGTAAEVLLPPTRSPVRARRSLADLAGGGATPLASALDTAAALALAERAKGRTPRLVLLTDGRGNVALDGQAFRTRAEADAQAAARRIRAAGLVAAVVDIAPRGREEGRRLAEALGALHAPLPYVDAGALRDVARALEPASARAA
jgi:magnesium chelatase subunit D